MKIPDMRISISGIVVFFMVLELRLTKIGCRDDNQFFHFKLFRFSSILSLIYFAKKNKFAFLCRKINRIWRFFILEEYYVQIKRAIMI